jgi:fructose-bisphosphate aldolase, class II
VRTDPLEAADYVAPTGVDELAVAVGSSHAMAACTARLYRGLIAELRTAVPVPLVLHGSSGVADDELRAAVSAGIAKVDIGTILDVALPGAVRQTLRDPALVDPRTYLAPGACRDDDGGAASDHGPERGQNRRAGVLTWTFRWRLGEPLTRSPGLSSF